MNPELIKNSSIINKWTLKSIVTLLPVANFSTLTTIKGEKPIFKINNYKPEKNKKKWKR